MKGIEEIKVVRTIAKALLNTVEEYPARLLRLVARTKNTSYEAARKAVFRYTRERDFVFMGQEFFQTRLFETSGARNDKCRAIRLNHEVLEKLGYEMRDYPRTDEKRERQMRIWEAAIFADMLMYETDERKKPKLQLERYENNEQRYCYYTSLELKRAFREESDQPTVHLYDMDYSSAVGLLFADGRGYTCYNLFDTVRRWRSNGERNMNGWCSELAARNFGGDDFQRCFLIWGKDMELLVKAIKQKKGIYSNFSHTEDSEDIPRLYFPQTIDGLAAAVLLRSNKFESGWLNYHFLPRLVSTTPYVHQVFSCDIRDMRLLLKDAETLPDTTVWCFPFQKAAVEELTNGKAAAIKTISPRELWNGIQSPS
ncbi:MAG: hypothetical protein Q4C01_00370 [Clostridia bacterium]|nr:hypothetical protein [Clostridia bacterium]